MFLRNSLKLQVRTNGNNCNKQLKYKLANDSAVVDDEFKSDTIDSTSGYQPPFDNFFLILLLSL